MAERKSGPVKPPVIDLKARETSGSAPASESVASPNPSPGLTRGPSPVPPARESSRSVPSPRSGSGPTAEGEGEPTESAAAVRDASADGAAGAPSRLSGGGTARSAVGGQPH